MKAMPSRDPADPCYRRLKYCRYADDWVLGFTGPGRRPRRSRAGSGSSCASIEVQIFHPHGIRGYRCGQWCGCALFLQ
jgi:hypothetical protein